MWRITEIRAFHAFVKIASFLTPTCVVRRDLEVSIAQVAYSDARSPWVLLQVVTE